MIPGLKLITEPKPGLFPKIGDRGGAVYNRFGANTNMVNCVVSGNSSTQQGGGVFNSKHTVNTDAAEIYMHNCLIAGNIADGTGNLDMGGGVFNGLGSDPATMELINCTLVGNYAGYQYGGAVNNSTNLGSDLHVRNVILWGNTDVDGGSDDIDAQLFYAGALTADDVDNNIIDHLGTDTRFNTVGGSEVNKDDDPVFVDTSTTATWTASAFDPDTGLTTFTVASISGNATPNDLFFQPDTTPLQLLIKAIVANTSIVCYGKWAPMTDQNQTGNIFDYHIDTGSGAIDYGDGGYYPEDNGVCDLDPSIFHTTLEVDLDLVARSGNPDCGAYEDN